MDNRVRLTLKRISDFSHPETAGKEKKEIHIEHDAWLYLTTLAKRDGVTISSFLISRLGDEYRQTLKA